MESRRQHRILFLALTAVVAILSACAKSGSPQKQSTAAHETITQKPLVSTTVNSNFLINKELQNKYEPQPTEIKTKTGRLILGQTQFSDIKYIYDSQTNEMTINGGLILLDKNQKELTQLNFKLHGVRKDKSSVIQLAPENSSTDAPILRAKVTCQNQDLNDSDDIYCQEAIVDFFILYKKQYYTDQFETHQSAPKNIFNTETTHESTTAEPVTELNELQIEGDDESLDGRYEGQVQTTNLVELFEDKILTDIKPDTKPQTKAESVPEIRSQNPPTTKKPESPISEKFLSTQYKQTADGQIRAYNQAFGFPNDGYLRNATSLKQTLLLLKDKKYFEISAPQRERYYGTFEMSQMLTAMGQFLTTRFDQLKLYVGNISAKNGGYLSPHRSHQIGMDADLAYPAQSKSIAEKNNFPVVIKKGSQQLNKSAYSTEKTFELLKFTFEQQDTPVARIFIDRHIIKDLCTYAISKNEFNGKNKATVIKLFQNIQHVDGHGDHFHLRMKCTDSQPACREKIYVKSLDCLQARN